MGFELEELVKRIKKIDEYLKNIEALKLNDKYKNYEADLNALRAYKAAIVDKFVSNMPFIKDSAKDYANEKLADLRANLNTANDEINVQDESLRNIYDAEEDPEEENEYFEGMYGTKELKVERQQLNAKISSYERYVNDPSWMLQQAFEKGVKFDEGTGYSPQFFSRGICLDQFSTNYTDYKDEIGKINIESFLNVVVEYMSDNFIESSLDEIEEPNFSEELEVYNETHINPFDVILNLKTQDELDEMKEEVESVFNIDLIASDINTSNEYSKYQDYKVYETTKKQTELNAKEIKTLLCGLTCFEKDLYTTRLEQIIALLAEDSLDLADRKIPVIGLKINEKEDYHSYDLMADYVKELFRRTELFETNTPSYVDGIDFDKIAKDAKAKYHGRLNVEQAHKLYDNLHKLGKEQITNRAILYNRLNGISSLSSRVKEYQNIIKECLNGTSILSGYDSGVKLSYNSENIGKISSELKRLYTEEYEEQSKTYKLNENDEIDEEAIPKSFNSIGLSADAEKKVCEDLLDGDALASEMMKKFNTELNLYTVSGNEMEVLNNKEDYIDTPIYKKALAKTEGLNCDKNSPLLNDAIATYGRMKEIHDNRRLYWLFHPFKNAKENRVIKDMKNTLTSRFGFTDQELNRKVEEVKTFATDNINKNFVKNNKENYKTLLENEKLNKEQRDKIIIDKLVAVDDEINLKTSNLTFIQSPKLRQGAYIENVDLSPVKNEMEINDFINHLGSQQAYLNSIKEKPLSGAPSINNDEISYSQLIKEIESYVDFEGFNHDEEESYFDKAKEVDLMLKLAKSTNKDETNKINEEIEETNKLNDLHKERRNINTFIRLNKFDELIKDNKDKIENKDILMVIDELKINSNKEVLNKNLKELNKVIDNLETKIALDQALEETFNKFLDQDMLQNYQEEKTLDKFKEKFDLNLDDIEDKKVEEKENTNKELVKEEEHIEL